MSDAPNESLLSNVSIGFVGAGAMAQALLGGLLASKSVLADRVLVSDVDLKQLSLIRDRHGVQDVSQDNQRLFTSCDLIVLCVKPHIVAPVLQSIDWSAFRRDRSNAAKSLPLVISIAAGIPLQQLASLLPPNTPCVRVVPNTPALVQAGISVISHNAHCSAAKLSMTTSLFSSVGTVLSLPESMLDAVTGLSGSGPAFIFIIMEALSDGGVRAGLPRSTADVLAMQTVRGAATLALETLKPMGALKDQVASPNGTTIRGIHELEKGGIRAALISAVVAASERSAEMGQMQAKLSSKL